MAAPQGNSVKSGHSLHGVCRTVSLSAHKNGLEG